MIRYLILLSALMMALASCKKDGGCIDSSKIRVGAPCTLQFDPVCGCNNITYGNSCEAGNAGVTSYTNGACN